MVMLFRGTPSLAYLGSRRMLFQALSRRLAGRVGSRRNGKERLVKCKQATKLKLAESCLASRLHQTLSSRRRLAKRMSELADFILDLISYIANFAATPVYVNL